MNKTKIKLISYILAYITFLSGTYLKYQEIIKNDKTYSESKDITTSQTTETTTDAQPTIEIIPVAEETQPIVEQTTKEELVTLTNNTTMYSSNTEESLKICNLKINTSALKILSCNNNWTLIKYNNQIGYVSNDCLETSKSHMRKINEYKQQKDIVLTTIDYINLKISPSNEDETIKILRINTELEVIATLDNGWLLVKSNDNIGYIQENYTFSLLKKVQKQYPNLNITELDTKKIIYSITNDLNICTESNSECEVINQLDKYESVRVFGEYEDWYLIMTNDYNFGFINKNYTEDLDGTFIIVDISEQRLYMYRNNILYCVAPVTTGKDNTPSDIGLFQIWHKDTDAEIIPGYRVDYWMTYNSNYEGLHDAQRWRQEYGMHTEEEKQQKKYKWNGSNGCINMERVNAKLIYENSQLGTKVLVHK